MPTKVELRKQIKQKLADFSVSQRQQESENLCSSLKRNSELNKASSLAAYYPSPNEPDIVPFLDHWLELGKLLALPRFDSNTSKYYLAWFTNLQNDLCKGAFEIYEPLPTCKNVTPGEIPVILVPGLAFAVTGHRLGRGHGHYDKLLSYIRPLKKIGICFSCQIVPEIPAEDHDVKMDTVLSGNR